MEIKDTGNSHSLLISRISLPFIGLQATSTKKQINIFMKKFTFHYHWSKFHSYKIQKRTFHYMIEINIRFKIILYSLLHAYNTRKMARENKEYMFYNSKVSC